jgi:hypothetical protein
MLALRRKRRGRGGTYELVDEETQEVVFLLWFVPEEG